MAPTTQNVDKKVLPLTYTAIRGDTATMRVLLANGADVNAINHLTSNDSYTALRQAAKYNRIDQMRLLVENGALVDMPQDDVITPLSKATYEHHMLAMRYLIVCGADVDREAGNRVVPLKQAKSVETARLMVESGVNVDMMSDDELPIVFHAGDDNADVLLYLLQCGARMTPEDSCDALMTATIRGHLSCVRLLLVCGAVLDPTRITKLDHTECIETLLDAGLDKHQLLEHAVKNNHHVAVNVLMKRGVDVDRLTPLLLYYGIEWPTFRLLLEHGADINVVHNNTSPMLHVIMQRQDSRNVVKELLKSDMLHVDTTLQDDQGRDALDIAKNCYLTSHVLSLRRRQARSLVATVAIGLVELDLPVLQVIEIVDQLLHLVGWRDKEGFVVSLHVAWECCKLVKQRARE
eukprot:TRINITY_DN58_c0_g4_i1.p1 TRINITY_DN58_c0_g4~~TRINITY_DN58_c0_g4_i1.p1  ORF type:complete len:406 (+),score=118.39 TRINITY_DN58_c0_g4_i1:394-1611(+)